MIIDFHTHTFPDKIAEKVVQNLAKVSCTMPFTDGSQRGLLSSMTKSGVDYSITLPVMTSPEQVDKIHNGIIDNMEALTAAGIIPFGGMHPEHDHMRQEMIRLRDAGIKGVKIHPAYQKKDLNHPSMMKIIDIASDLGLIIITHAGIDIGIYDHDYASISHVLEILDQIQPQRFVLAHMGGWGCWEAVENHLAGAPVYFDTAFSVGPIVPLPGHEKAPYLDTNLTVEAFARLCHKHGTDKILFATDSPWQDQSDTISLIRSAPLSSHDMDRILYQNAAGLLQLPME